MRVLMIATLTILSGTLFSQPCRYLETVGGRDYYIVENNMNVRKCYRKADINPYPDKLNSDDFTRHNVTVNIENSDAKIEYFMIFDTYKRKERPYKHDPDKNAFRHKWEAAKYDIKKTDTGMEIKVLVSNWKHNWNRFNDLRIIYSVPEKNDKADYAKVIDHKQIPSRHEGHEIRIRVDFATD